jgi:hypothetical protein
MPLFYFDTLTVWVSPELAWHASGRHRPAGLASGLYGRGDSGGADTEGAVPATTASRPGHGGVAGLGWQVPHLSTLSRRQKDLTITIPYRRPGWPLVPRHRQHRTEGAGRGRVEGEEARGRQAPGLAQGAPRDRRRQPRGQGRGDEGSPAWRGRDRARLAGAVAGRERIGVLSGEGAYDTRGVDEASAAREAALVVPPRRNSRPWKDHITGASERNESLRATRHLGRRLWKRWSGYHRRRLTETAMARLKRLAERLSAPRSGPSGRGSADQLRHPEHLQRPWHARHRRSRLIRAQKGKPHPQPDLRNSAIAERGSFGHLAFLTLRTPASSTPRALL